MIQKLKDKNGIRLFVKDSVCTENIDVVPELQNLKVTGEGTYHADEGYAGIGEVTVEISHECPNPTTEEAEVTPSTDTQYVTPKNANYLSKVTVLPIPDTYVPSGYIKPSGTTTVTTNGTHDVKKFEFVKVAVPTGGSGSSGGGTGVDYEGEVIFEGQIDGVMIGEEVFGADTGTTWAEWCESEYNTIGLVALSDTFTCVIQQTTGLFLATYLGCVAVLPDDEAVRGGMYVLLPAESLHPVAVTTSLDDMTREEQIAFMLNKLGVKRNGGEA